ncbi:recombinase family protein [Streptomyces decoyicus]|uniref:recombinase family protein n=1 Tax=Streptomyces decoyicus TaxID=249567 RepID=UPI0038706160
MKPATSSPERQREDVLSAAASVGGHIIGWADDWEVSGAMDPVTRPKLGPWLRDERGPYDGLVAAAVDRIGRNVVDCLNTGYKMRDEGKLLVTYGHEGPWDLDDATDENRFTMEAWGAQMELRAIQRRNRSATVKTRAAGRPKGKPSYGFRYVRVVMGGPRARLRPPGPGRPRRFWRAVAGSWIPRARTVSGPAGRRPCRAVRVGPAVRRPPIHSPRAGITLRRGPRRPSVPGASREGAVLPRIPRVRDLREAFQQSRKITPGHFRMRSELIKGRGDQR